MTLESDSRPWGSWRVIDAGPGFQVKRIDVVPGGRLSYQTHARRSEHWCVVAGEATCTLDGEIHVLGVGESLEIPAGAAHRIANLGARPLVVVEMQWGPYLGEDDIVRLSDDYGRA